MPSLCPGTVLPAPQLDATAETPFKKIMAANRGEIAIRITRAGTELGLKTVSGVWQGCRALGLDGAGCKG